jgi:hypothetical protein
MVRPEGLEPPAYWFEANRSIQLSYRRGSGGRYLIVSPHGLPAQYKLQVPIAIVTVHTPSVNNVEIYPLPIIE